jgi:hypothetical protein
MELIPWAYLRRTWGEMRRPPKSDELKYLLALIKKNLARR